MQSFGVEVDKKCDYCGKSIFAFIGNPNKNAYHMGCQRLVRIERDRKRGKIKK